MDPFLIRIFMYMLSSQEYPKMYLYRRIVQAKLYMDKYYGEQIRLDHISEEAYFSKFHFIRLFKAAYTLTPHQYLIKVRLENACRQLKESNLSVEQICFNVGLDSVNSFCNLFKKHMGLSPLQFRERELQLRRAVNTFPLAYIPGCFAAANGWVKK